MSGPSNLQPSNSYRVHTMEEFRKKKGENTNMCCNMHDTLSSRDECVSRFTGLKWLEKAALRRQRKEKDREDSRLLRLGEEVVLIVNEHGRCF